MLSEHKEIYKGTCAWRIIFSCALQKSVSSIDTSWLTSFLLGSKRVWRYFVCFLSLSPEQFYLSRMKYAIMKLSFAYLRICITTEIWFLQPFYICIYIYIQRSLSIVHPQYIIKKFTFFASVMILTYLIDRFWRVFDKMLVNVTQLCLTKSLMHQLCFARQTNEFHGWLLIHGKRVFSILFCARQYENWLVETFVG